MARGLLLYRIRSLLLYRVIQGLLLYRILFIYTVRSPIPPLLLRVWIACRAALVSGATRISNFPEQRSKRTSPARKGITSVEARARVAGDQLSCGLLGSLLLLAAPGYYRGCLARKHSGALRWLDPRSGNLSQLR